MNWHYTENNDYPQPREGKNKNDEFQCLVYYKGDYTLLCWNCYYECWDDEWGDDCVCNKDKVDKWIMLDDVIHNIKEKEVS